MPLLTVEQCNKIGLAMPLSRSDNFAYPKTERDAYLISLAKWSILYYMAIDGTDIIEPDGGGEYCGLCMLYADVDESFDGSRRCIDCPIRKFTGNRGCLNNVPYMSYNRMWIKSWSGKENGKCDTKDEAAKLCLEEIDLIDKAVMAYGGILFDERWLDNTEGDQDATNDIGGV